MYGQQATALFAQDSQSASSNNVGAFVLIAIAVAGVLLYRWANRSINNSDLSLRRDVRRGDTTVNEEIAPGHER